MNGRTRTLLIAGLTASLWAFAIDLEELPPPAKQVVDFKKEIWPLFQEHCVKCHGPDQQKSGYRIDIAELALEGGEMGEAIIPGVAATTAGAVANRVGRLCRSAWPHGHICATADALSGFASCGEQPKGGRAAAGMPRPAGMLRGATSAPVSPAGGRRQGRMRPRDRLVITLA